MYKRQLALNATTVAVVWFGGNMIIGGKMQVGDLTAFINYIVQIMGSLTMLSIVFLNWARAVASFRRVREVLEEEIDLTDDNALYKERKVEDGNISFKNEMCIRDRYIGGKDKESALKMINELNEKLK